MKTNLTQIKEMVIEEANKLNLEVISVEWVNEYNNLILRIIADTKEGLTIDESTALNEAVSERLDGFDMDEDEYMLEVSSPGIERELLNDEDIINHIGSYVFVEAKNQINITPKSKVKELFGTLNNYENGVIEIKYNNKGKFVNISIEKENIKLIRLAIKF